MAEFFTVEKNGKRKQVLAGKQLAKAKSEGWELAGTKRVTTETGERTVEAAEAERRLATGEAEGIVSAAEIGRRAGAAEKERQFGGRGVEAFGLGAVSSIPLVGGELARDIGAIGTDDLGTTQALSEENAAAYLGGQVAGTLTQLGVPGPGGLLAKGATKAGKAVTGATGSKVAGSVAEGVLDGAAWTVAQNHADAVIAGKPVDVEMLVADLPSAMLFGGAIGAAVPGLSRLSEKIDARKLAKKAAEGGDLKAWQAADDAIAKRVIDAEEEALAAGLDIRDAGKLKGEAGEKLKKLYKEQADHKKAMEAFEAQQDVAARKGVDSFKETIADDIAYYNRRATEDVYAQQGEIFVTDRGRARRITEKEWKTLELDDAYVDYLSRKVGKPAGSIKAADYKNWVNKLSTKMKEQGRAVDKALRSGKYLDGELDDVNALLQQYSDMKRTRAELSSALKQIGHEPQPAQFSMDRLKGLSETYPEFATTRLTADGKPTELGQKLIDEGLNMSLIDDPGASTIARTWYANKKANDLAKTAADASKIEDDIARRIADEQAYEKSAISGEDLATTRKEMAERIAGEAKIEQKRFRLENKKPKAAPEPKRPTGLVEQLSDATLGRMSRVLKFGQERISDSVGKFIKFAGKPRRGTVPAASTILGNLRFDEDLGVKPKGRKEQFKHVAKQLDELGANPEKAKERIQKALRNDSTLKPAMAGPLAEKALQRLMFLHGLVPRSPNVSAFGLDNWQPSNTEIDKFTRIAAAAEDPYSILDDLNAGTLTQEAVDTVKQLYPEIYHSIQMELVERADEIKQSVSYQGRLQLGILFQAPTDEVLQPRFIRMMQENYALRAQEQEQQGGGQFSTPGAAQKSITSTQTASQRIESK